MKQKLTCLILALSMLLTGCGVTSGRKYVSIKPHRETRQNVQTAAAMASDSLDLMRRLEEMIRSGTENGVIYLTDYPADRVEGGMELAVGYAMNTFPLGAYAVEAIDYEIGTNGSLPAMAVEITYRYSNAQIRQIRDVMYMEEAKALVEESLREYAPQLVIQTELYFEMDFQQLVRSYAEGNPDTVMEMPRVAVEVFGTGASRVVELSFAYQNSRDALQLMRTQVKPFFDAASMYVSGSGGDRQKYAQLYSFLMERFDYKVETSITPAYSMLHHGVGDSRAFATVFSAMCRRAGLECMVVTGTRSGEPWVWNMILDGNYYRHVDLLRCNEQNSFRMTTDREMEGYVWDYSAYPECPTIRPPAPVEDGEKKDTEKNIETKTGESGEAEDNLEEETVEPTTEATIEEAAD